MRHASPSRAGRKEKTMSETRDAYWHCGYCGNHEPAEPPYVIGDREPCCLCSKGTAVVMTLKAAAALEQQIALGNLGRKSSYSDV